VLLVACACAPNIKSPGPWIAEPAVAADGLRMPDGAVLPLRRWMPDEPPVAVILALHGFNDYSNAFDEPAVFLRKHGIATYAYDQRGFGGAPNRGYWPGETALLDDLATAMALLRQTHPGLPLILLGESMGGGVILAAMARDRAPQADGVVLVAPAVWGRATMDLGKRVALWVAVRTAPWMTLTGRGLDITPSDNIEMLRKLSRDPLVIKETRVDAIWGLANLMDDALDGARAFRAPSLILYGEKDDVIPKEPTRTMIERMPPVPAGTRRLAVYPGGYHMLTRDLQAEIVLGDIAFWIRNRARGPETPLPSGADARGLTALFSKDESPAPLN
jgi:alpha-beta hydrolase superfamily lysophospholipase